MPWMGNVLREGDSTGHVSMWGNGPHIKGHGGLFVGLLLCSSASIFL